MVKYWKHKNVGILKYNTEQTAGPVKEKRQALSDWSRLAKSGEKCSYFINGKSLSDIRTEEKGTNDPNELGFKDENELQQFFVKHLFSSVSDKAHQEHLANLAMMHFHQAGLPHATNFCIKNLSNENPRMKVADPHTRVDFIPSDEGVSIKETNTYRKWHEMIGGARPREHVRSPEKSFYAKTETSYLLTNDAIKVTDLTIDCPSKNLAPIFDKRPEGQQIYRAVSFLRELVASALASMTRKPNDEPQESVMFKI